MSRDDESPEPTLVEKVERVTEVPMLLLALVYMAAFVAGYLPELSPVGREDARFVENVVIAVFAAELVVRVAVAERRLEYLRSHWLDAVIVLVPLLRPLRLLTILRFVPLLARTAVGLRRVMGRYRGAYVLVVGLLTVFLSAALVLGFENGSEGSIQTFADALWWAVTTVTTVGYGDTFPVTPGGRAVAVFLMLVGIALFGVVTAGVAAYFVESHEDDRTAEILDKLDRLEERFDDLDERLRRRGP